MYYLNSRYYNPEIGRFINVDGLIGETGEILSHNMYAYTSNNPIMRVDPSGYAWYHWALSGAAIVVGVALIATGAGGPMGGMLLAAGVNSMILGVANKESGGSFEAGWAAGAIIGLACGYGASVAGEAYLTASASVNMPVLINIGKAISISAGSGFIGGFSGTWFNQTIDGESFDLNEATENGSMNAIFNIGSGLLSGGSSTLYESGYKGVAAGFAGTSELVYDSVTFIIGKVKDWAENTFNN